MAGAVSEAAVPTMTEKNQVVTAHNQLIFPQKLITLLNWLVRSEMQDMKLIILAETKLIYSYNPIQRSLRKLR